MKLFEHYRMLKGKKGLLIRYVLIKTLAKECGDNVSIHPNVYLFNPQNLSLGDNVSIHPLCYIEALGGIDIGSDVSIAHGVTIMSTSHIFDKEDININNQGTISSKTVINDNVWIGAKSTILSGNTIESRTVIAASAVVTKDVSSNTVVGGVPANVLKNF
ncbi:acyltransferase [Bacillus infantis]|uniref:acyltransferase n=1 Tax=Bacillus infantis TaxID=324767 RepID=UPI00344DCF2B